MRQACGIARLSRTAWYRPPRPLSGRDGPVMAALEGVLATDPRWGLWKCFFRLRALDHRWNHKRVHRVYCALRLNLLRRTNRRLPARPRHPLAVPRAPNTIWALDFMADPRYDGRPFRVVSALAEANREVLAIGPARSLPSLRVVAVLEDLVALHGALAGLRGNNGTDMIAETLTR